MCKVSKQKTTKAHKQINPLLLLLKALLHGQKDRVFFSMHLNLRTPETGLPSRKKIITIKLRKTE